jgi:NO-binding membrane sensor protein with MHYT domain
VLSYALSVLGSLLGLTCTVRARRINQPAKRARWLLLAAWAIGGTGIWVMHFMAMFGYTVSGEQIRYDPLLTFGSLIIAIGVVAMGLFLVGFGRPSPLKIIMSGILTGVGIAGMHYTGVAAMEMPSTKSFDESNVILSVCIAIVAATVALWFTVTLRRGPLLAVAALIMGFAVNGMHYTAMYGLRISGPATRPVGGILPIVFVGPIAVFVIAVAAALFFALLSRSGLEPNEELQLTAPPPRAIPTRVVTPALRPPATTR